MTSQAKANVEKSELEIEISPGTLSSSKRSRRLNWRRYRRSGKPPLTRWWKNRCQLFKKDIYIERFGLVWLPYYAFEKGEDWITVPAFRWGE
jgi:hypothetical protein